MGHLTSLQEQKPQDCAGPFLQFPSLYLFLSFSISGHAFSLMLYGGGGGERVYHELEERKEKEGESHRPCE